MSMNNIGPFKNIQNFAVPPESKSEIKPETKQPETVSKVATKPSEETKTSAEQKVVEQVKSSEPEKQEMVSAAKTEADGMTAGYWIAAGALAAVIIGGICYAICGRGDDVAKKGARTMKEINDDLKLNESIVDDMQGSFTTRAMAIKAQGVEILKNANKIKNDVITEFSGVLDKDGKIDSDILKLKTDGTSENLVVIKNADGIDRHIVFDDKNIVTSITDWVQNPDSAYPKRTRYIFYNSSGNQPSIIKIRNEAGDFVEYAYGSPKRPDKVAITTLRQLEEYDEEINRTVFLGDKLTRYKEDDNLHKFIDD